MRNVVAAVAAFAMPLLLAAPIVSAAASLKGTVVLTGAIPAAKKLDVTIDQFICGTEKDADDLIVSPRKEVSNAVVWLENPPPSAPLPSKAANVNMDQKACVFIPRIVMIPAGQTVFFLNSDRLLHNIHATPSVGVEINAAQPRNRTIPVTFARPEIVRISCDLHPWMTAWVVVAAHPYYAITGADGQFGFENLPPGQYKLHVWHERLGKSEAIASVGEQQKRVTIELKAR